MIIPRLPPANNPLNVTITVNERLRPYFTVWFQRFKLENETPEQFALRKLKEVAMDDYIRSEAAKIQNDTNTEMVNDIQVINSEVE